MKRTKVLPVQNLSGRMITAQVMDVGSAISVRTEPIPQAVGDDLADENGQIFFVTSKERYQESIDKLVAYIEALVLRSLSHDYRNPSVKPVPERAGDKITPAAGVVSEVAGQENPSVDSGGDGDKPTPRPRKRKPKATEVAEDGDSGVEESAQSGHETLRGAREGDE